jgi:outer membrane protein assembly factor BamB
MTMIELGVIASGSEPEPEPAAGRMRRHDIRRIGVVAVTLLCVLAVTGSTRPEPRSMPVLWSTADGTEQFALTEDALYTLEPGRTSLLTKHSAATGEIHWSKRLPEFIGWLTTEADGLVLLPAGQRDETFVNDDGTTYQQPVVQNTIAVDAATGVERWRQPGEVALVSDETVVLSTWDPQGGEVMTQRLVRSADGALIWDHLSDHPSSGWATVGATFSRPERVISVTKDGRMEVFRYSDGKPITSRQVPWRVQAQSDEYAYLFGMGDTVYSVVTDNGQQDVTAYHVDTLAERWRLRVGTGPGMFDCGPVLCVGTEFAGVDGRDPRTGRLLWHSDGWDWARPVGDGMLLAESRIGDRTGLIDAATGLMKVELGRGMTVVDAENVQVLTLAPAKSPPYGYTVSELDSTGEIILRGRIGPISDHGCQLVAGRLACAAADGELSVRDVG